MGNDLYMLGENFSINLISKIILSEIGIIQSIIDFFQLQN